MSRDCCVALPHSAMGLSSVFDCGISLSFLFTFFETTATLLAALSAGAKTNGISGPFSSNC